MIVGQIVGTRVNKCDCTSLMFKTEHASVYITGLLQAYENISNLVEVFSCLCAIYVFNLTFIAGSAKKNNSFFPGVVPKVQQRFNKTITIKKNDFHNGLPQSLAFCCMLEYQ